MKVDWRDAVISKIYPLLILILILSMFSGCSCEEPPATEVTVTTPSKPSTPEPEPETEPEETQPVATTRATNRSSQENEPGRERLSGASARYINDDDVAEIEELLEGPSTTRLDRYERLTRYYPDLDYVMIGSILEALARAEMLSEYPPPENMISGGVKYYSDAGVLLGELDLVIVNQEGEAVVVGEVKLSSESSRAMGRNRRKARQQLQRFRETLQSGGIASFDPPRIGDVVFTNEVFAACNTYIIVGPRGSTACDFDREMDINREEGDALQRRLVGHN